MIIDRLDQQQHYVGCHPAFWKAFHWLKQATADLEVGKHPIDGDVLFAIVGQETGKGEEKAVLESHRKYIDIQTTLVGLERIGWRATAECSQPIADHDETKDIRFYQDRPDYWVNLPVGHFAIFYPGDAHAPLGGSGAVKKIIVKIAVN